MTFELDNIYTYHKPHGDQQERYEKIRAKAKELAELINSACSISRETELSHYHIESAVMWANASIARNESHIPHDSGDTGPMPGIKSPIKGDF